MTQLYTAACNAREHTKCDGQWWQPGRGPNTGTCRCACHDPYYAPFGLADGA